VPVAHACNSSYSGGRDQEGHSLKPAWVNSLWETLSHKNPPQKRLVWSASRCSLWVQTTPVQQKKKSQKIHWIFFYGKIYVLNNIEFFLLVTQYMYIFFFSPFSLLFLHLLTCVYIVCAPSSILPFLGRICSALFFFHYIKEKT
jgi:hypothetical protein